jgi:hypothetical protein
LGLWTWHIDLQWKSVRNWATMTCYTL